jgi:dTDP-glucose 4,6-dehydratase
MNILVTGGSGFIGSNFVRNALEGGEHRIVNLDKLTYAGNPENLASVQYDANYHFVKGDICDVGLVSQILESQNINAVVNFAAESHVDRSIDSPEPFFETNVLGTLRLINSTYRYWKTLSKDAQGSFRFLHVSTDEVYGSLGFDDAAFSETTPYSPNSPYSASKAGSDHIINAYQHTYGLPTLTTNCSNNYGPYQFPEKLIPLIMLNALDGKDLPIYGDGMNVRDWLYVEDHCRAIMTVLKKGRVGETYNIGGDCECTNIKIVDTLCSLLDKYKPRADGKSYKEQKIFVKDRPGHDRRYAIDARKIKSELAWAPQENFSTGMEKTVQWYLNNREWCGNITQKKYARERLGTA